MQHTVSASWAKFADATHFRVEVFVVVFIVPKYKRASALT